MSNIRRVATAALFALAACGDPLGPDGSATYSLLFERQPTPDDGHSTLFTIAQAGATPIALFDDSGPAAQPRVSADGLWVAYMASHPGTVDDAVWIVRADGSQRREVYASTGTMARPAPSPDGTKIAFVLYNEAATSSRIWVVDADGSNAHLVTPGAHDGDFIYTAPAWSPNGQRLAFAMGAPGSLRLATMAASGGEITMVTQPAAGSDTEPAYSPNGSRLAYVHATSPSLNDVMTVDLATGVRRTVYTGNGRYPTWTPDATALVVAAREGPALADLYVLPAAGGTATRLTSTDMDERYPNWIRVDP